MDALQYQVEVRAYGEKVWLVAKGGVELELDFDSAGHQPFVVLAADHEAALAEERERREAAEKLTQDIVAKHAEQHLGGYRELGARAAAAENERDALTKQLAEERDISAKMRQYGNDGREAWLSSQRALGAAEARLDDAHHAREALAARVAELELASQIQKRTP